MSALGQRTLVSLLTDTDAIAVLASEGLDLECIASEDLRKVVAFSLDYYHRSGRSKAPSAAVLMTEFGDLINDNEIDFDNTEESIEWALDDLKGTFVHKEVMTLHKNLAIAMSEADTADKVSVAGHFASGFVGLVTRMERKDSIVDMREGMVDRMLAYEARAMNPGAFRGMTFGLGMIDSYTRGIHPGELACFAAGPKFGKAEAVETPVLTPSGWRSIGSLAPGDRVVGSGGRPITVVATVRWQDRPLMRVTTDDGGTTVVDAAHDWTVRPHSHGGREQVVDTATLARKILTNKRFAYLPLPEPIQYDDPGPLPLHPYLLGVLLGDGSMTQGSPSFCKPESWLHTEIDRLLPDGDERRWHTEERGMARIVGGHTTAILRDLGLWGCRSWDKFIPEQYMHASVADRRQLLAGLLDTDGGVEGRGITFCSTSERLGMAVRELVLSLGGTARVKHKPEPKFQNGTGRPAWVIRLRLPECPFRLPRKREDYANRDSLVARSPSRRIVEITPAGRGDTVCIQVDAPDHLYVTEDFMLTHNSYFAALVALNQWRVGRTSALYTLENSVEMTQDRIACLATHVNPKHWEAGEASEEDVERVRAFQQELAASDTPLWVLQPAPGLRTVEAMVRDAQMRGADNLLLDQLTFIEVPDEKQPRHLQIRDVTHSLKTLISTGRDKMPCLLMHQINRDGVKQADKVGHLEMYHLAEGSEVERTCDWVFGGYRSVTERAMQQAKFQTMAARRADVANFQMGWNVAHGLFTANHQIELD